MIRRSAVLAATLLLTAAACTHADEFAGDLNAISSKVTLAATAASASAAADRAQTANYWTDLESNPYLSAADTAVRDYTARFDLRPRGLDAYTAHVRVYIPKTATAKIDQSTRIIEDEDEGIGPFQDFKSEGAFPNVGLVRVTLVNERTGEIQSVAGPMTLELLANAGSDTGYYDFSGKLKDEKKQDSVRLKMPELQFPQLEIVLLPFVTGEYYTSWSVDAALSRSGDSYTLSGLDFDQLIAAEKKSPAVPQALGWRHNYWDSVEYVTLQRQKTK